MIFINPLTGDPIDLRKIKIKPRVAFIMSSQGNTTSKDVENIRFFLKNYLKKHNYKTIDATDEMAKNSYMEKIFYQICSVGFGLAVIDKNDKPSTLANIFYEIGLLASQGKPFFVIKTKDTPDSHYPSDFSGVEYINYDAQKINEFERSLDKLITRLDEQLAYWVETIVSTTQDIHHRLWQGVLAYLLSGDVDNIESYGKDKISLLDLIEKIYNDNREDVKLRDLNAYLGKLLEKDLRRNKK